MSTKKQLGYITSMVEDLINENTESSQVNFHEYLQSKTREIVLGEAACDDEDMDDEDEDDEDDDKKDKDKDDKVDESFSQPSEGSMSTKTGKIKFKNGGKNTAKTLEPIPKAEKIAFKKGGKQPAKTLEKTPKPASFDDGRDMDLGTT